MNLLTVALLQVVVLLVPRPISGSRLTQRVYILCSLKGLIWYIYIMDIKQKCIVHTYSCCAHGMI